MSNTQPYAPHTYVIVFQGHLDERRMRWFEGMNVIRLTSGETVLTGPVIDQAALRGLLGSIHDLGLGVPQSFATARRWYEQAAEKGQVDAMLNLAILYENGRGVQASCRTALQWYRRSAERGSEKAKAYLPVIERSCR